jgi:Domain of unknown function (DUF1963)
VIVTVEFGEMVLLAPGVGTPLRLLLPSQQESVPLNIAYFGKVDSALLREGFVVVGDGVIRDGSVSSCMRLWTEYDVIPSCQPDHMLVIRDVDPGGLPINVKQSNLVVEITNGDCDVVASVVIPKCEVLGQLLSGEIVTDTELIAWNGTRHPHGGLGKPVAVVGGRFLVCFLEGEVQLLDVRTGDVHLHHLDFTPENHTCVYDVIAGRVIIPQFFHGALIISGDQVINHTFEHVCSAALWSSSGDPIFVLEDLRLGHKADWVANRGTLTRLDAWPTNGFDRFVVRKVNQESVAASKEITWTNSSDQRPLLDVTGRMSALDAAEMHANSIVVGVLPVDVRSELDDKVSHRFRNAAQEADVHPETLLRACRPSVAFRLAAADDDDVPLGASRFGGRPDVPDSFEWITFNGHQYSFMCQLRCDELHSVGTAQNLPLTGWVLVFVDLDETAAGPDDKFAVAVVHVEDPLVTGDGPISRRAFPKGLDNQFQMCWVGMVPWLTLPPMEDLIDMFDFETAEVLIDATRSAWPDHHMFGFSDLRIDENGSEFYMKFATDDVLGGIWRGAGWLNILLPEGDDFLARIDDATIQVTAKRFDR